MLLIINLIACISTNLADLNQYNNPYYLLVIVYNIMFETESNTHYKTSDYCRKKLLQVTFFPSNFLLLSLTLVSISSKQG